MLISCFLFLFLFFILTGFDTRLLDIGGWDIEEARVLSILEMKVFSLRKQDVVLGVGDLFHGTLAF